MKFHCNLSAIWRTNNLIGSEDNYEFHTSHRFFLTKFGLNDNEIIILERFILHRKQVSSSVGTDVAMHINHFTQI